MKYIWNTKTNCFDGYEPEYEIKIDEATGEETKVLVPCTERLYTENEVKNMISNIPQGMYLKSIDGSPVIVMRPKKE